MVIFPFVEEDSACAQSAASALTKLKPHCAGAQHLFYLGTAVRPCRLNRLTLQPHRLATPLTKGTVDMGFLHAVNGIERRLDMAKVHTS